MINVRFVTNGYSENMPVMKKSTIRSALEEQNINYARALSALDGHTIRDEELDMTFEELGATDGSVMSCIVKAANAASATVYGNAMVITSDVSLNDFLVVAKYSPKNLLLYEHDEKTQKAEAVFRVAISDDSNGCVSKFGVALSNRTDQNQHATVTVQLPADFDATIDNIEDLYGEAIMNLCQVEENVLAAIPEIQTDREAVRMKITIN